MRERIKKAEREMQSMLDERDSMATNDIQVKSIEEQLQLEKEKLHNERNEMDKLIENKE